MKEQEARAADRQLVNRNGLLYPNFFRAPTSHAIYVSQPQAVAVLIIRTTNLAGTRQKLRGDFPFLLRR